MNDAQLSKNDSAARPSRSSLLLRIAHLLCVVIAVLSTFFIGIAMLIPTPYRGITVTAHALFTLTFAYTASYLSPRAYAPTENSRQFLISYSRIVGYLGVAYALYLFLCR